jgi:hypothetical protein
MSAIPGPPDRPDVPEFWQLSEIVLRHDAVAKESDVQGLQKVIAESGVPESVVLYVAKNRAALALKQSGIVITGSNLSLGMAMWIDAFLAGMEYQKKYGQAEDSAGKEK